jgi:hypothetical protein
MPALVGLGVALALVAAAGWGVLRLLRIGRGGLHPVEAPGLLLAAGLGATALAMLVLPWNRWVMAGTCLALLAVGSRFRSGGPGGATVGRAGSQVLALLFAAALALRLLQALGDALAFPVHLSDAFLIWEYKAKAFHLAGGAWGVLARGELPAASHPEYPLLVPLAGSWLYLWIGRVHDQLVMALHPLFLAGLCAAVYATVRAFAGRAGALGAALFVALPSRVYDHVGMGFADLPLAWLVTAGTGELVRHRRDGEPARLARAALYLALGAATKMEGIVPLLLGVLAAALPRGARLARLRPFLVALLVPVAWTAARAALGLPEGHLGGGVTGARVGEAFARLPGLAARLAVELARPEWWLLWPLLLVALPLARGRRESAPAWIMAAGTLAAILALLAWTPQDHRWLCDTALPRVLVPAAGPAVIAAALAFLQEPSDGRP